MDTSYTFIYWDNASGYTEAYTVDETTAQKVIDMLHGGTEMGIASQEACVPDEDDAEEEPDLLKGPLFSAEWELFPYGSIKP
jgi:hypothetical protein